MNPKTFFMLVFISKGYCPYERRPVSNGKWNIVPGEGPYQSLLEQLESPINLWDNYMYIYIERYKSDLKFKQEGKAFFRGFPVLFVKACLKGSYPMC